MTDTEDQLAADFLASGMSNIPFLFMQDSQSELEEHDDSYQMEVKEEVVMDHNSYKVEDEMDTMVERRMRLQRLASLDRQQCPTNSQSSQTVVSNQFPVYPDSVQPIPSLSRLQCPTNSQSLQTVSNQFPVYPDCSVQPIPSLSRQCPTNSQSSQTVSIKFPV